MKETINKFREEKLVEFKMMADELFANLQKTNNIRDFDKTMADYKRIKKCMVTISLIGDSEKPNTSTSEREK